MKEQDIRHVLLNKLREHGAHAEAIENAANVGTPDVNACYCGQDLWFECKYRAIEPVRSTTPLFPNTLRPAQRIWFMKRIKAGARNVFFFFRCQEFYYLMPGAYWETIEAMTKSELAMNSIVVLPVHGGNWNMLLPQCLDYLG